MHEALKNRTYIGKKLFFNFLGANFLAPKSRQRHEKQPLLGPGHKKICNEVGLLTPAEHLVGFELLETF